MAFAMQMASFLELSPSSEWIQVESESNSVAFKKMGLDSFNREKAEMEGTHALCVEGKTGAEPMTLMVKHLASPSMRATSNARIHQLPEAGCLPLWRFQC
jgi:hypothetical protein